MINVMTRVFRVAAAAILALLVLSAPAVQAAQQAGIGLRSFRSEARHRRRLAPAHVPGGGILQPDNHPGPHCPAAMRRAHRGPEGQRIGAELQEQAHAKRFADAIRGSIPESEPKTV